MVFAIYILATIVLLAYLLRRKSRPEFSVYTGKAKLIFKFPEECDSSDWLCRFTFNDKELVALYHDDNKSLQIGDMVDIQYDGHAEMMPYVIMPKKNE